MRVAGALTLLSGVLVSALLLLLPTNTIGGNKNCVGMVATTALHRHVAQPDLTTDPFAGTYTAEANDCITEARSRAVAALVLGSILVIGGGVMLAAGSPGPRQPAVQVPPPGWWWDGSNWNPPTRR